MDDVMTICTGSTPESQEVQESDGSAPLFTPAQRLDQGY
jgi:hypothetical protein